MPKRKNPFGDTAPIQLKTHVGFKQAATDADKQQVYEKTRAMLFQGANPHLKNSLFTNGSDTTHSGVDLRGHHPQTNVLFTNDRTQTNGTFTYGYPQTNGYFNGTNSSPQAIESSEGSLHEPLSSSHCKSGLLRYFSNGTCTNGVSQNGHTHTSRSGDKELTNGRSTLTECRGCHRKDVRLVIMCSHCEGRVCGEEGCLRQCCVCQLRLCQLCTVLNYTEKEVRTFCFDCLPMVS